MKCKGASRIFPEKELTPIDLISGEYACDVSLNIIDSNYSYKILQFQEYLLNLSYRDVFKKFYSIECNVDCCSIGYGLLRFLNELDVTTEEGIIDFNNAWNYIILKNTEFNPTYDINENDSIPIESLMIYYGPSATTPVNEADVLALNSIDASGESLLLNTGNIHSNFSVIIPPTKVLRSVNDDTNGSEIITEHYVYIGVINIVVQGFSVAYKQYELNNAIPYSSNHEHTVKF